jgi:hypothetical protein
LIFCIFWYVLHAVSSRVISPFSYKTNFPRAFNLYHTLTCSHLYSSHWNRNEIQSNISIIIDITIVKNIFRNSEFTFIKMQKIKRGLSWT